jgi:hypothetical protein
MFERRHYEAVARVIGEYLPHATQSENGAIQADTQRDDLIHRFVTLFEIGNARFDSDRFIEAVNRVKPKVILPRPRKGENN